MISMFMQGGPSQVDLFDPKPELTKRHLQTYTGDLQIDNAAEAMQESASKILTVQTRAGAGDAADRGAGDTVELSFADTGCGITPEQ